MKVLSRFGDSIEEHLDELWNISKAIDHSHDPDTVDEVIMDIFLSCIQLIRKSDLEPAEKGILLQKSFDIIMSFYDVEDKREGIVE